MKLAAVLKVAAAALATGALLVTGTTPAQAAITYPPHVSMLYVSPIVSSGYTSVAVYGDHLAGLTVQASRGAKTVSAPVSIHSDGTIGTALVKVSSVLSTTAGRYDVDFTLLGPSVEGNVSTTQNFTVGTYTTIRSLKVAKKSYGLYISGYTAKYTPVKITMKITTHTYVKTVKSSSKGYFYVRLYKTYKGTYDVTAQVSANTKYFSDPVNASIVR